MTGLLSSKKHNFEMYFSNRARVWIAIFSALFALFAWALSSPIGSTPDEDYHLVSIWCGQGERVDLCEAGANSKEVKAPTALVNAANCFAFHPELSGNCRLPNSDDLTLTSRSNSDGGYPPVFYWTMSFFSSSNIYLSVLAMRFFNAILFIGLTTATMLISPRRIRLPVLGGILITSIPLGMFLIPSVNPSSWAIISAASLWGALMGYFRTENKKRRWLLFVIALFATLLGAGARSDSAVYSCIALTTAVILSWGEIRKTARKVIPALIIIPVTAFFYLRSGQSAVATSAPVGHGFNLQLAISNLTELPGFWLESIGIGNLGWLDTPMPSIVWGSTLAVFFGVIFLGLSRFNSQKIASIALMLIALTFIPLYVLVKENISIGTGVQPRYVYPLVILFAGIALWKIDSINTSFSQLQVVAIMTALSIAYSLALHTNIRRYVTGNDAGGFDLNRNIEWWWPNSPGPMFTWAVGSIAFLVLMLVLANSLWRYATPSIKKNVIS